MTACLALRRPKPRRLRRGSLLAGVSSAASGIQTAATVAIKCSFQPYTQPWPTRFGPVCLGINRGMRHFTLLSMFLVPYTTVSSEYRAVGRRSASAVFPRTNQVYQVASQATDPCRQAIRDCFQAAFPRAPRRIAAFDSHQGTQSLHLGYRLRQHTQQLVHFMQMPNNNNDQRFQEQSVWINFGSSSHPLWWSRRHRNSINQCEQRDKKRILHYHRSCLRIEMFGNFYDTAVAALRPALSEACYS